MRCMKYTCRARLTNELAVPRRSGEKKPRRIAEAVAVAGCRRAKEPHTNIDARRRSSLLTSIASRAVSAHSDYLSTAIRGSPRRFGGRSRAPRRMRNEGPTPDWFSLQCFTVRCRSGSSPRSFTIRENARETPSRAGGPLAGRMYVINARPAPAPVRLPGVPVD